MLYAIDDLEEKILATPQAIAYCPHCFGSVYAKCGDINIWHWAHKTKTTCDTWKESEGQWHLAWKALFPKEYAEIQVTRDGVRHIADLKLPHGMVVEFQHSPLSPDVLCEREEFYGAMMWIFDIREPFQSKRLWFKNKQRYYSYKWKHPKRFVKYAQKPVYFDLGIERLFQVKKMHTNAGWGYFFPKQRFVEKYNKIG